MDNKSDKEEGPKKPRSKWRWLKRGLIFFTILILLVVLLGWMFLPRIAEHVIRGMITEAGLENRELSVTDIGWRSAIIEDISMADGAWSIEAKKVELEYDPWDLLDGSFERVSVDGLIASIDLSSEISSPTPSDAPQAEPVEALSEGPKFEWVHELPMMLKRLGEVQAKSAQITIHRDGKVSRQVADLKMAQDEGGGVNVLMTTADYHLDVVLIDAHPVCDVAIVVSDVKPAPFLTTLEMLLGIEEPLLPDGFDVSRAELRGGLTFQDGDMSPLSMAGNLHKVHYDGGGKPVMLHSDDVVMKLTVEPDGSGEVIFETGLDEISLPLDPSADFELAQRQGGNSNVQTTITWGEKNTEIVGRIGGLDLTGSYAEKPVDLSSIKMDFEMIDNRFSVDGSFMNGGSVIPIHYDHTGNEIDAKWTMQGRMKLGPFKHDSTPPLLLALADAMQGIEVAGVSQAEFDFSVGSLQPFRGKMVAGLSEAQVALEDDVVKVSGLAGLFELHIIPLADDDPSRTDPSYYTFDFSAKKLSIDSKEALDFDLEHQVEQPLRITGKGRLGMDETEVSGEVKNLTLHGERDDMSLDLVETGFKFDLKGDRLTFSGQTMMAGNKVPFSYQHNRKDVDDGWELDGMFQIKEADLSEPIDNAVMFVEAMEGMSIKGKMAMKMDFSLGSKKDFDGVLTASVSAGTLTFADDGPIIEGLKGDIRLSSMKNKQTQDFHRVTAAKIKAFDMEMRGLRLDYKMLPNGDIMLRNIALSALGGQIWLDPFTLPGGDEDYKFKVRAKRLDVAELAKLFPDFNGDISGRIDGLLPMQSVDGNITPSKGGMYLTPRTKGRLRYDAGDKFSAGLNPKTEEYKRMKMVEDSLRNLDLEVLSIRLFDPRDKDKAIVLKLRGQAHNVPGSPPIHLNINGFKPDDDTVDFFDLLLKHRDRLDFGL